MTIQSAISRWAFTASGASGDFDIDAPVLAAADIAVIGVDQDDGSEYAPTYTVEVNADFSGATVHVSAGLTADDTVIAYRVATGLQPTQFRDGGRFPASSTQRAVDRLTTFVNAHSEILARTLRLGMGEPGLDALLPEAARAGKFLQFDENGVPALVDALAVGELTATAFAQTMLALGTAALWRSTLGVPSLAGGETFTVNPVFPAPSAGGHPANKTYVDAILAAAAPPGSLAMFAGASAPAGWLHRNGDAVSRTTYAALFDVLVTGDGFSSQNFTVTLATPGVFTKSSHGFTGGERLRLSTTGALPTGLDTSSDYFVIYVDADTFRVATSEANYAAGTAVATSGSQSGTHSYRQSLYGLGDGSTTFNLPDDRDLFAEGLAASGRSLGTFRIDQMQGHYHTAKMGSNQIIVTGLSAAAGASRLASDTVHGGFNDGNVVGKDLLTDGTNGTPRAGTRTRPRGRAYLPIIKT